MKTRKQGLTEREQELVELLMSECESTSDIQAKLKRLFAGTIEQMLEAEMDEHLGYEKHSVAGNNSGNSRNGYGKKKKGPRGEGVAPAQAVRPEPGTPRAIARPPCSPVPRRASYALDLIPPSPAGLPIGLVGAKHMEFSESTKVQ